MKTKEEIKAFVQSCKDKNIHWYKKCLSQYLQDKDHILYIAQTPQGHNYLGYQRNTTRCYEWTIDNGWVCLFSNTKNHRAKKFLTLYKKGLLANVNPIVIENYLTNGYNTRRGLLANYTDEQIERMKDIGRSHADYIGHEIDSTTDHDNRVYIRSHTLIK